MEKTITIQRNKVFFSILLSVFIFSAFFLNYLNVSAADCGGCGQPACPVTPPPTSPPPTSPSVIPTTCTCKVCSASNWCSDRQYTGTGCPCIDTCSDHCECGATLERCKTATNCTCSVIYSSIPCANTCRRDTDCSGDTYSPPPYNPPPYNPPPTSPPPTSPPPTLPQTEPCMINYFELPERAWVGYPITGRWSASDWCDDCDVDCTSYPECVWKLNNIGIGDIGANEYKFTLEQSGTYNYTLTCYGEGGIDERTEFATVEALNLPWWREIIPVLPGFLRGIFR